MILYKYFYAYSLQVFYTTNRKYMFRRLFNFYFNGFRNMTWGKSLWAIILIKLFIMFIVLKVFFFPDFLNRDFNTDEERSDHVLEQLTNPL